MTQNHANSSPSSRLRFLMEERGITAIHAAARSLGIASSTLQNVIRRDAISRKTAQKIATQWGVSVDWVERGWGPMRPDYGGRAQPDPFRDEACAQPGSAAERLREVWRWSEIDMFSTFAEACGLATEDLQRVLDTGRIDEDTARRVADRMGISYQWIYRGEGPFQLRGAEIEGFRGADSDVIPGDLVPQRAGDPSLIYVPKASSKLSAGGGTIPDEEWSGQYYAFREDWLRGRVTSPRNAFLMEVTGDSMDRDIRDGDIVLVDIGERAIQEGHIYAIAVGGAIQIKKLEPLATGRILVRSLNPLYHSYEALEEELRVIGRVKWLGREL